MKKIAIVLTSFLVFATFFANATNDENDSAESAVMTTSVSGTVLDVVTGEALVGVKLTIEGTDVSVYTDFEGNFKFERLQEGDVAITASYISYKKKTEKINIDLSKSNTVNVKIESL